MKIANRRILLTGATGGIGQAFARMLDSEDASLILTGRNASELQKLNRQLGNRHHTLVADIQSPHGRNVVRRYCENFGIDILINNAGISEFALFEEQNPARIEELMNTNLLAPMLLTQTLLPLLKSCPEAMVVNIGSTFGSIGYPGFCAYSASKFGMRGFTEALRRELFNTRIKVLYLSPRATRTAMNSEAVNDLNKALGNAMDSPEVVAAALNRLMTNTGFSSYLGWPEKLFVRLNSLLPRLVDRAIRKQLPAILAFSGRIRPS